MKLENVSLFSVILDDFKVHCEENIIPIIRNNFISLFKYSRYTDHEDLVPYKLPYSVRTHFNSHFCALLNTNCVANLVFN